MFERIPQAMRSYRQWIVWRYEWREDDLEHQLKPTKIPYNPNTGHKASVSNPSTWVNYDEATAARLDCNIPVDSFMPVDTTGFTGVGFVLTVNDPYTFIDLDDAGDNQEVYQRQLKIFQEFNSYSELSPSGNGLHIIVEGSVPVGRRRANIEVYSSDRYMTMTGDVYRDAPIVERQELLTLLFNQMGGGVQIFDYGNDEPERNSDEVIIDRASNADNGDLFKTLYNGDWTTKYSSQSEADFALVDIFGFYSDNKQQIKRLFQNSKLGARNKKTTIRGLPYIEHMIERSFDRKLKPLDFEGLRAQFDTALLAKPVAAQVMFDDTGAEIQFPPGLVGEIAAYILAASPRPVPQIALAGAIGLVSGICGRSYNISGAGVNQYILMLAQTGTGKDAIEVGTSKLLEAVKRSVPAIGDFVGPGELVSSAGLIKHIADKPSCYSILGEFGIALKMMADPRSNSNMQGLQRTLLQMYSRSGQGNTFGSTAYSDKAKNTAVINAPALTILGESVPERFYESLDDGLIDGGLLPRFAIFEYNGKREYFNEAAQGVMPSFSLTENVATLAAYSLTLQHQNNVINVVTDKDATEKLREFDRWTTDQINETNLGVAKHLWNRAHLKAMKLAAVIAIGINPYHPVVTINETMWSTNEIVKQTTRLLRKFERSEIGADTNELKQRNEIYKVIAKYMAETDWTKIEKYGGLQTEHQSGVIRDAHIQRRVISMACFRNDKFGASNAIKRAIQHLLASDELREMPKMQMRERFGNEAKAYVVSNPIPFREAV